MILTKLIESIADTEAQCNLIPQVKMPIEDLEDHSIQSDFGMVSLKTIQLDHCLNQDTDDKETHDLEEVIV